MGRFISDVGVAGIEDDFVIMTDGVTGQYSTDDVVGAMRWDITNIGNGAAVAPIAGPEGILRITTSTAAAGDGVALHGATDMFTFGGSGDKEGGFGFRFRLPTGGAVSGSLFRFGIDDSVTATDPAVGIFIKKNDDGTMEVQAESTNGDLSDSFSGVPTFTSGTTPVINTWHQVDVKWWGENVSSGPAHVRVSVDGTEAAALDGVLIGNAETAEYKIAHFASATTAAELPLDIDFYYAWQAR